MDGTATSAGEHERGRGLYRSRWAAIGAAVAVALGGGTLLVASAADSVQGSFVAIAPCRVVDTRPATNVGPRATPLGPNETYSRAFVGAVGKCNIPSNAYAVVLSLVVVNPTAGSYLTVFPDGGAVPLASNLNYTAGQAATANSATVQIGAGGQLSFYNLTGTVDVIADVSGYYVPAASKSQQLVFTSRSVTWNGGLPNDSINGCTTLLSGTPFGIIPVDLPIGAVIGSMSAVVYDNSTASTYHVRLDRQRQTNTSLDTATGNPLLDISGGGSTGIVTSVAGASSGFAVSATDSYWIEVDMGAANTNAFCSAAINVTMP